MRKSPPKKFYQLDGTHSVSTESENTHDCAYNNKNEFRISLVNARSLIPKLESLYETQNELQSDVSILTETWININDQIKQILQDNEDITNYALIRKDRKGMRGGGVAISYNKNKIQMSQARLPQSNFEVVAAVGRRTGQRRKVVVLAVYIPPSYNADRSRRALQYVNDCLLLLSSRYDNPHIFVGGDFNRRDAKQATRDLPSIKIVPTPPTRGRSTLDIILTNVECIVEAFVTSPIQSNQSESDHKVVNVRTKMPRVGQYQVRSFSYVHITEEGLEKFRRWLTKQSWNTVYKAKTADEKVDALHCAFKEGVEECFESRFQRRKTTEPPWMTDTIRDMIRKRRKIFRADEGRSLRWMFFKKRIAKIVKKRKKTFYKFLRDKFTGAEASKNFYKNVNSILRGYEQEHWDVRTMRPGATEQEIAEELSTYFNKISEDATPLDPNSIPPNSSERLPILTTSEVENQIKNSRRPTSTVPGDLPPAVYKHYSRELSPPITDVYNAVIAQNSWLNEWRKEYITVIPKTASPDSFD